jgi:foldase protein PrsA
MLGLLGEAKRRGSPARDRRVAALLAVASASAGLIACGAGAGTGDAVVARVGHSTITEATLSHWTSVLAPEHAVPDPPHYSKCIRREENLTLQPVRAQLAQECARQYRALRQRALAYLISSHWLIGEAADKGLVPSARQVQAATRRRLASADEPPGEGAGGPSASNSADAAFQARVELASASIRNALFSVEPQITQAVVARQYTREAARFRIPERRDFEIFEHIPSMAAARRTRAQIMAGHRDVSVVHLHEWLLRPTSFNVGRTKGPITVAIFAASPHVLSEPIPLNGQYALFELTKIRPARVRPLAQVEQSIRDRLTHERQQRTLARFIRQWRRRWSAKTDCAHGYVVQKCRQYAGRRQPENPLALS